MILSFLRLMARLLLIPLLRLAAYLPLSVLHSMGRLFGTIVYLCPGRYRRRLRANAAQAGYGTNRFARQAAAETGAMIFEMPKIWFQTNHCVKRVYSDPELQKWVKIAQANKQGIIFLTPHLGCFEICASYQAQQVPLTVMFRPPRVQILMPLLQRVRNTSTLHAVTADTNGVRAFVRTLRRGECIGMLPDQVPATGDGVWAPFFGRMAYTVTLPGKLAKRGDLIIMVGAERLPRGRGWRLHALPMPGPLPQNPQAQATLINAAIETLIRRFPQQYLWSYNRYKTPSKASPMPSPAPPADQSPT